MSWSQRLFSGAVEKTYGPLPFISDSNPSHMKNWLSCLRSRKQPNATVDHGFAHSVAVIMAARAQREGKQLYQDLTDRIKGLLQSLKKVNSRAPRVVKAYQRRLIERVKGLSRGLKLDRDRIHQEVALYAERCDVTEEAIRLQSHAKQFEQMISGGKEVGRSLDFLIQEMNREVNTIGSKGNDVVIAREVVRMKAELEKLREQVQNIE